MPILKHEVFDIDYQDEGEGPAVILIHSAASNNRQWRKLIDDHKQQYRFLAINLYGYGETTSWPVTKTQSINDQVALIEALSSLLDAPVCLVGHSFGGTVAAYAAMRLADKVSGLILLEANPFPLLARENRDEEFSEVLALRDFVLTHGARNEWQSVAERFVDYWLGENAWNSLSPERQQSFVSALPNNLPEWQAVMGIDVDRQVWQQIDAPTLLLRASQTKAPIRAIYEILREDFPDWQYREISEGGHMAPVTRPDLVNPMLEGFLSRIY